MSCAASRPVLVTGAAGFIGGYLAVRLVDTGISVTALDVRQAPALAERVEFRQTDCADPDLLRDVRRGAFRAVVHQAGISNTLETAADRLTEHNVTQPLKLAAACATSGTGFVYASSFSVYGRTPDIAVRESDDRGGAGSGPLNLYARSKLTLDERMRERYRSCLNWAGLRYTNVFAPGEPLAGRASSVISQVLHAAATGRPIRLFGDTLGASRDYLPAERIVRFVREFLDRPGVLPSGVYNLGSGTATSFAELLGWTVDFAAGRDVPITLVPNPIADRYQYWTLSDNSALAAHLPWATPIPTAELREHAHACFRAFTDRRADDLLTAAREERSRP